MLKVDYDAMETAATTLADQGDTFETCIETMGTVINGLPDIWEAETCTQYVSDFNEAKKTLTDVRDLIKDMSDQMKQISKNFRDADEDMKKQMQ
ncbi:MAG: WXG100 family type VII secretion target [Lachnospiraceae bacterium]|nr:WXG100 family type VII secretion target [Lachnospiraceae bacterium]